MILGVAPRQVLAAFRRPAALRLGAAALALVAAVGPSLPASRPALLRVLVHDASASAGALPPREEDLRARLDATRAADRLAVVVFGEDARVAAGPSAPEELRARSMDAAVGRDGSELARALRLAGSLRDAGREGAARSLQVLVATDGLATDPRDALADAALALRAGGGADLHLRPIASRESPGYVSQLVGPGRVAAGEPFVLEARGAAAQQLDEGRRLRIELLRDGEVVETREVTQPGPFRAAFARIEDVAGEATYAARATASPDVRPALARVHVTEPGRVLVLTPVSARAELLTALGPRVTVAGPDLPAPELASLLASHDVAVVDAVPERLVDAILPELAAHVSGGGGLVLLGGSAAFAAGGWSGRPIDRLSPLRSRPEGEDGLFLYVALDGSGSMAEPWAGGAGGAGATRHAVVRAAAESLVGTAAPDTSLALRRFAGTLLPDVAPPEVWRMDRDGREAARDALAAPSTPGGATALVPPLEEARALFAARPGRRERRHVLLLTDGRTAESSEALRDSVRGVLATGAGLTVVLPGAGTAADLSPTLREALAGTPVEIRDAAAPDDLARVFREVEDEARAETPFVHDRMLGVAPGGERILAGAGLPALATRLHRTWLAPDARALAVTDRGEPAVALRREGIGTVAACAAEPGDAQALPSGDHGAALLRALVRAAARPASATVRAEREGADRLLLRVTTPPGAPGPSRAALEVPGRGEVVVPLVPAGEGLLALTLPRDALDATSVRVVAANGLSLATVGLDASAAAEWRVAEAVDFAALAALARAPEPPQRTPIAPWLAAGAVLLLVAASWSCLVKSTPGGTR